jgi:hypothetical protein
MNAARNLLHVLLLTRYRIRGGINPLPDTIFLDIVLYIQLTIDQALVIANDDKGNGENYLLPIRFIVFLFAKWLSCSKASKHLVFSAWTWTRFQCVSPYSFN